MRPRNRRINSCAFSPAKVSRNCAWIFNVRPTFKSVSFVQSTLGIMSQDRLRRRTQQQQEQQLCRADLQGRSSQFEFSVLNVRYCEPGFRMNLPFCRKCFSFCLFRFVRCISPFKKKFFFRHRGKIELLAKISIKIFLDLF